MHNYQNLKLWQKARELVELIYRTTADFPKEELYGITSQIRRCAVSIPSNIAEGAGRNGDKEFSHFLSISQGSSFELETQLILSSDLGFISQQQLDDLISRLQELQKMNRSLQNSILRSNSGQSNY